MQISGNAKSIEGKLKKKYGALIDDDKLLVEGKLEELIGFIEEKTGKTKEAILDEIQPNK